MPNLTAGPPNLPTDLTSDTIARTLSTSDTDPIVGWLNGAHDYINQLDAALNARFDMTVDPGLLEGVLTQPTGLESLVASITLGHYRLTAPAAVSDVNYRSVRACGKAGVMGDSEVRSTWFAQSTAMSDSHGRFQPGHAHRITMPKQISTAGTATAGGATSVTNSGAGWTAGQWAGVGALQRQYYVTIIGGTGLGQTRRIVSNTTTALTVDAAWGTNPAAGSIYEIWSRNIQAVTLSQNIAFNAHAIFNVHCWDGASFNAIGQVDLGAYLKPGGTYVQFPWFVKTRVRGLRFEFAIWKGSDAESDYDTAGRSYSVTLPAGWDHAGMSGWYLGHLQANDYLEFDNFAVIRL